ncbi:MAG: putative DNA binding domain-containing protein [Pelistega sp.]|nr:putative DNA binding domain-containing protein [Pelistega sp.]
MLKRELLEIIANGENSGIEFKRDDIRPEQLGKEIVAMANFQGGRILLGVDDDGTISGVQRSPRNTIVMEVLRDYGYVDYRGMGVRTKIVPLTRALSGKDPKFELTEDYLKTVLYR